MTTFNGHNDNKDPRLEYVLSLVDPEERDAIRMAWNQAADVDSGLDVDQNLKENVRAKLMAQIAAAPEDSVHSSDRQPATTSRFVLRLVPVRAYAIAASILLLVGISFVLAPDVHVISAPVGSQVAMSFDLPDGSTGHLSAGSEIRYSDTFNKSTRLVALKGEAVFNVVKSGTSFIVKTHDANVSVLGTTFSVRSWASDLDRESVVSVHEGRVAVAKRYNSEHVVELAPSQQLRLDAETAVSEESILPITDNTFSWVTGGADFVNMPIGNVLSELSRRYGLVLKAPTNIRDRRITLLPSQHATIEDVLVDMSAAVNIRYRKIAGGFEFYLD